MTGRLVLALLASVSSFAQAIAHGVDKAREAARIERVCGLKPGTIRVFGDEVQFQPSPAEAYNHVDCALTQLNKARLGKLGFVGNEADPNAVLHAPLRYIAEGPKTQIDALAKALQTERWAIVRTATASDGSSILQFESGPKMTNGEAMKLMNRIWKNEFGDLEFGIAPRKVSDRNDYDD